MRRLTCLGWALALGWIMACGDDDGAIGLQEVCDDISGLAQTFGVDSVTFRGQAIIGVDFQQRAATATTLVLSAFVPQADSTLQGTTAHTLEFGGDADGTCDATEDCFSTNDDATLTPTDSAGVFGLNTTLTVVTGTGDFANPVDDPQLQIVGTVRFPPPVQPPPFAPSATWGISGTLCHER